MTNARQINPPAGKPQVRKGIVSGHEAINARLRPLLLDMAANVPDRGTNRPEGESYFTNKWLSPRILHKLPDPAIRQLIAVAEDFANRQEWPHAGRGRRRLNSMWAIISRSGMEGRAHKHGGLISGAYYVDAGDCDDAGNGAFAIYSPEGRELLTTIQPETGMMLMFPNTLWHGVLRYEGETPRIVVSFNLV